MTTTTATPKDTASSATTQGLTNVNVSTPAARDSSLWTVSRVVALVFTVLEVLLLVRFALRLLGANADQPLVSAVYGFTNPLVEPFRGVFAQPGGTPVIEIATLLSILFFVLLAAVIVAIVRSITGRRGDASP